MTGPLVIVGCGRSKHDHPMPALDLGTSSYAKCAARWARSVSSPDRIYLLSAKHGLIPGDQVIAPYRATFLDHTIDRSRYGYDPEPAEPAISDAELLDQARRLGLAGPVILLASPAYGRHLATVTGGVVQPYNPFTQLAGDRRRGYQMRAMNAWAGRIPATREAMSA